MLIARANAQGRVSLASGGRPQIELPRRRAGVDERERLGFGPARTTRRTYLHFRTGHSDQRCTIIADKLVKPGKRTTSCGEP